MRRREFALLPALALGALATRLRADHHILSLNPLIVNFDLPTLNGRYTEVDDFYIRNHFEIPRVPEPFSLRIEGEVQKPQVLGMDDLRRFAIKEVGAVLECAGDSVKVASLVSDGLWEGWPLGDVISMAGPKKEGLHVHFFGHDGYARSVPLERAMNEGMLISRLNGRPLVRNHGAPWRVLFPGWYGQDSVKWLKRVALAPAPLAPLGQTYMEVRQKLSGSIETKPLPRMLVNSVITSPVDGAILHPGKLELKGLGWSGNGRIRDVEASADGGKLWRSALVGSNASEYDWVLWRAEMEITQRGAIELVSRAIDSSGNTQPPERDAQRVDSYGNNVWSRVRCVVV
jgi:DMSO/TMAO reductase YedYZ molybdopterin-dependent catalytic subunit